METQPQILTDIMSLAQQSWDVAEGWARSPAAWSQFALIALAFALAFWLSRRLRPILERLLTPPPEQDTLIAKARRFALQYVPLLFPLLAFVLTDVGENITRSVFGTGAVIAFGNRLILLIAVRIWVKSVVRDPFLKVLGRYLLLPIAALHTFGLLGLATAKLEATVIPLGNLSFSLLFLARFAIVGGVVFWLGRWSNAQSTALIQGQTDMRPATRELASKAAEILIFGVAFLLLMNIMGISLTSLAVLGGAIGVGLGFGLQKIASNFISGVILLIEGQATVGDYVELDGGEAGTIVKMTARAAILETFDGRWIVVPNEDFITTRVVNFSDSGSANRYEAPFSVSYDTDITKVPALIEAAVAGLDFVLDAPDGPDCELRGFGDSGVDFAVEFWVNGIDDGKNKFTPQVLMTIWTTLKAHGIEIPYPHRVVEIKGPAGALPV
ncbi:mechanosensitive ion channel [Cognatishimia sp. SS12]|uniref:mechanosensitive ion channel family protein n=1 Tax=Cognatishimia sp. SS12 TaxID=2979465 RepID=UPI00232F3932|nr:mechanosensitive ion channel domain-containing protein [Cognatishimia sp. SS12]MDC0737913.1 mechanosensitive ion channel [Cognatishimia sp. SS12]